MPLRSLKRQLPNLPYSSATTIRIGPDQLAYQVASKVQISFRGWLESISIKKYQKKAVARVSSSDPSSYDSDHDDLLLNSMLIKDHGDKNGLLFFACRLLLLCYNLERKRDYWSLSCWSTILPVFYNFLSDPSIIWATKVLDCELNCPI